MPKAKLTGAEAALQRGLAFLERQQEADGSFVSYSSASIRPFRRVRSWQTVFVPALILAPLAGLEGPSVLGIRDRLAGFLLEQKDDNWSFNYWAKGAPEYRTQAYPNDLDDTFCALAGLYLHDPAIIDEAALAKAIKLLLATEVSVGGPYRTWLVSADSEPVWTDVDVAVNSNIAYFLSLTGSRLPKLDGLMGDSIATDDYSSPYYPSVYAFIYYFARAYGGPHKDRLLRKARQLHKKAATDLDRALALSARVRLGETQSLAGSVRKLLAGQRRDGAWPAATFYADPVKDGKLYYNGGPALTTAFVLETLELCARAVQAPTATRNGCKDDNEARVLALAKRQCRGLEKDLRSSILRSLDKLASGSNGPEIIGLPWSFNQSLAQPLGQGYDGFLADLGLANLYGWLAYTIYDDFLDEEGRPRLLPVANVAMRRSLDAFTESLPGDQAFRPLVRQIFDTIDSANAWELAHCRFEVRGNELVVGKLPDYGDLSKLSERSLGHTLPALAVLTATGLSVDDDSCQQILEALCQYLIVRQLNDDTHDWPEDLQNGHITLVVVQILSELRVRPGSHPLPDLLAAGRRQFWHATLPKICRLMRQHIRLSRQALRRSGRLKAETAVTKMLDSLETSIEDTLAKQSQAEKFLKQYKRKAAKS